MTGDNRRLIIAGLADIFHRYPSHIINRATRPIVAIALRFCGLSRNQADQFAKRYHDYQERGINVMCDAFINSVSGARIDAAFAAVLDDEQVRTVAVFWRDLLTAIEESW